jgi:8-oxo-dGTP pyrophosphatase MutT (NUDIX family)
MTKRIVSILIPYRLKGRSLSIYLQKRSDDMERLPSFFGFWGGGLEKDETPKEALIREIREELEVDLDPDEVLFFDHYEFLMSIKNVFLLDTPEEWEANVVVHEGDFGKWFGIEDALKLEKLIFEDKVVLNDMERKILEMPIR